MTQAPLDIRGKTVVITGAASGIGKAVAKGFLRDGAKVMGCDRDEEGLAELADLGALVQRVDVRDREGVAAVIERAHAETGRLDVLMNNAGIGTLAAVADLAGGKFERMIAVHLFGMIYGLHAAIPIMRQQGGGRIINTLSRAAAASQARESAYSAAKAGMWAAMRSAARECVADNILINGMIPGPTRTGMSSTAISVGRDIPPMQEPEAVYPTVKMMATFPDGGPTGKVFWDEKEYALMSPANTEQDIRKA